MNYKVKKFYGYHYLSDGSLDENQMEIQTPINGQLCSVNSVVGKLWSVTDSVGHNGGHGMGMMYGSKAILATADMQLIAVSESDEVTILD